MAESRIPHSLPQAAPISRDGMKTPADTVRPYVQHARKKYVSVNKPSVRGLYDPLGRDGNIQHSFFFFSSLLHILIICIGLRHFEGICLRNSDHNNLPGWLWKRLRTLLSGVLKKAVAMELYSPSAQNSCRQVQKI